MRLCRAAGSKLTNNPPGGRARQRELADQWRATHTFEVFPPNPFTAALGLIGEDDHLVSNSGVKRILQSQQQFRRLEDATTPFHVIATDVLSGAKRRLSRGDAQQAVLASAAIPGVFPSIQFDGSRLVDGGVAENTPIADAVELGADTVYVLPTGAPCTLPKPPSSAVAMLVHALALLINQRLAQDIAHYSQLLRLIVFPPPCPQPVPAWNFDSAAELIEGGYRSADEVLSSGEPEHPRWHELALARLSPHAH